MPESNDNTLMYVILGIVVLLIFIGVSMSVGFGVYSITSKGSTSTGITNETGAFNIQGPNQQPLQNQGGGSVVFDMGGISSGGVSGALQANDNSIKDQSSSSTHVGLF